MRDKFILPPVLYKYESFNTYSLSNLKNAQIYFNRPVDFNDPFDCSLVSKSFKYEDSDIIMFYNYLISKISPNKPNRATQSIKDVPDNFKKTVDKVAKEFAEEKQKKYLYKIGCCCFSESKDNLLLWSHYSDGHKGFCLEFDTSFDPFKKNAFKVEYSNYFPKLNPIKIITLKNAHVREVLIPLLTKYSCWEHEKEWRIYHEEPQILYKYEVEALKAVYFGTSMENSHIEIIYSLLQGKNPNIEFYKAKSRGFQQYFSI